MTIQMKNGETFTLREGDAFNLEPGHEAWVEGDERCVLIDFGGFKDYAKKKAA
jgi:quercetin dioxygenase-like cupin family protein